MSFACLISMPCLLKKKSEAFYMLKMIQSEDTMEDQVQEQTQRVSVEQDYLCVSFLKLDCLALGKDVLN